MLKCDPADFLASFIERVVALLASGANPINAWHFSLRAIESSVEDDPESSSLLEFLEGVDREFTATSIADRVATVLETQANPKGTKQSRAASEQLRTASQILGAAWQVAEVSGAPLAQVLTNLVESLRGVAETNREISLALSSPKATAKVMVLLPLIGIVFGIGLGFDPFGVLFSSGPGRVCGIAGIGLLALALYWNRRLIRRASKFSITDGVSLELLTIALSGGASIEAGIENVKDSATKFGLSLDLETARSVLDLSVAAGVPVVRLLSSEARLARRKIKQEVGLATSTLSVKLLAPMGVCILPAFMLLGVAPMILAIITQSLPSI